VRVIDTAVEHGYNDLVAALRNGPGFQRINVSAFFAAILAKIVK
jgi:hypothetical protein